MVGRAGVGFDNVDVDAATSRGVMVVNAPESNILSAAEQAMALLLAQARNIPQAHAALIAGRWERSKWEGVELHGKTLGIVGLGHVGALVAQRALAFGMRLIAFDPYVSVERARRMSVELCSLEELMAESDFVTLHSKKTPETVGMISKDLLAKAKPGIRIINTSRGGIIDEEALAEAVREGIVAGAGLDVFDKEPTTESPLFELDSVVVSPHLGASTAEAQDKAGVTIAEQVLLALAGDFVPFAVNVAATEVSETVRPFMAIAEQLGRFFGCLHDELPDRLDVEFQGQLATTSHRDPHPARPEGPVRGQHRGGRVTFVNAPQMAERRGLEIRETSTATARDYVNLITLRSGTHALSGTLAGAGVVGEPRFVMVDDHTVEVPPSPHMLVVRNDDRPGMIGVVGTVLGDAGISISLDGGRPQPGRWDGAHGALDRGQGDRRVAGPAAPGSRHPGPASRQPLGRRRNLQAPGDPGALGTLGQSPPLRRAPGGPPAWPGRSQRWTGAPSTPTITMRRIRWRRRFGFSVEPTGETVAESGDRRSRDP